MPGYGRLCEFATKPMSCHSRMRLIFQLPLTANLMIRRSRPFPAGRGARLNRSRADIGTPRATAVGDGDVIASGVDEMQEPEAVSVTATTRFARGSRACTQVKCQTDPSLMRPCSSEVRTCQPQNRRNGGALRRPCLPPFGT